MPAISVIICSVDAHRFRTISAQYERLLATVPHEIIRIGDARSLAEGYNRGLDRAQGEVLIFSHDDLEFLSADVAPRLLQHLEHFDLIGVAGASRVAPTVWHGAGPPYVFGQVAHPLYPGPGYHVFILVAPAPAVPGIQVLDGLFLACRRTLVAQVRFDPVTFDGFHGYDVDFSFAAHLAGCKLAVCTDIPIIHASAGHFDARWQFYTQRFAQKYAGRFTHPTPSQYQLASVLVRTKQEVLERLTPPYLHPERA